ncbi:MAG: ferritin-like domain-containing protein [Actinobacteria bacterium]|nr:ferritin-like domain-containing protein [Actinomycetota bacterium]
MTKSEKKIVQYLNEAHATEMGLTRVLQEQIAIAPRGRYRSALERHLRETRDHATRVAARRRELQSGGDAIGAIVGTAQDAVGQMLALAKAPLDIVRGTGGEEKVLKNAKDACATEALEIATYIALEHLARSVADTQTAELALSIRRDEEAMLEAVRQELPALARAVARAEIGGDGSYDISESGAADALRDVAEETERTVRDAADETERTVRDAADETERTARSTAQKAKRTTARQARRVPGAAAAEGAAKGAVASEEDLPISGYDSLTAEQIVKQLPALSQVDLTKVEVYERKTQDRSTVLERIEALRGDEPWPGYDEMNAAEIVERLRDGDEALATKARDHERAHKGRATVLRAAERELTHA